MAAFDDDRLTAVGLFLEAHQGLVNALERGLQADCGLSGQWFEILLRLARSPRHSLRMCDLAAQTGLSPSGLTRAVDRLEEAGLVHRRACPSDRRVAYAELTPKGLERLESAVVIHLGHVQEQFIARLTPAEVNELARITRKLRDQLRPQASLVTA
jgi:MarR family transcriptional regulator, 2-MHQ and catechol-resistance regulon repressor